MNNHQKKNKDNEELIENLKDLEKQLNILINDDYENNYYDNNYHENDNLDNDYREFDNNENEEENNMINSTDHKLIYLSENNEKLDSENSDLSDTEICKNTFECEKCYAQFNDYVALIDHIIIYHDNIFEDEYVDDYIQAKNDNIYSPPQISNNKWNEYLDLNININEGDYECIICKKKYITAYLLGEHFSNEHSSYEQQYELDKNIVKDGYPSLDILQELDMISIIPYYEINEFRKTNIKCQICDSNYHFPLGLDIKLDNKKVNFSFNDDMEIKDSKINKLNKLNKKYSNDDLFDYNKIIIKDEKLTEFIKDNLNFKFPIKTNCCKNLLCNICFIENLKNKNDIICLFCQKDFNKKDSKYINFIEFDKTNSSWEKWWINHSDIF